MDKVGWRGWETWRRRWIAKSKVSWGNVTRKMRVRDHGVPRRGLGLFWMQRWRLHHVLRLLVIVVLRDLVGEGSTVGMLMRRAMQHLV